MEIGKLKTDLLEKYIFDKLVSNREEVIMGGGTGLDNAVMDFGGDLIVASTDPITGASKNLGALAINISVNDVSCQCADPVGVLMTLLIPPSADLDDLKEIVDDATRTARELNVDIVGGHTEVTDAVNKIVISTTVIGRVNKNRRPDLKKVKAGDVLAVSKYLGIEGTSIIAHEKKEVKEILSKEEYEFAKALSKEISVLKESILSFMITEVVPAKKLPEQFFLLKESFCPNFNFSFLSFGANVKLTVSEGFASLYKLWQKLPEIFSAESIPSAAIINFEKVFFV